MGHARVGIWAALQEEKWVRLEQRLWIEGAQSLSVSTGLRGWSRGHRGWRRTTPGTLTRVSTMLDLLFRSVFTMWNTSMMFCCWIISHTLQMAQKVPLRPPPFLNTERQVSRVLDPTSRGGGAAAPAEARRQREPPPEPRVRV